MYKNSFFSLEVSPKGELLYSLSDGKKTYRLSPPAFEIDGKFCGSAADFALVSRRELGSSLSELHFEGTLDETLSLSCYIRVHAQTPFIRFRWELSAAAPRFLTKSNGKDALVYLRFAAAPQAQGTEIRFSEYNHQLYSFCLTETPAFRDEDAVMGPMLTQTDGAHTAFYAYEHGSQYPDRFLEFHRTEDEIELRAVKGNYYDGRPLENLPYETVWLQFGAAEGGEAEIAALYRKFQLRYLLPGHPSRKPYIYYNTWNCQERNQLKTGSYHGTMSLEYTLADIDRAHRMGIDVYVLDTGWFNRCGDWQVNEKRFPDSLSRVREKLDGYGMKLGLWINPCAVALSSPLLEKHRANIATYLDKLTNAFPVWESETSHGMCLASDYWRELAATLVALCKEKHVSYIKWDAIWQYGCTDGHHLHGTEKNSLGERGECYSFELDRSLSRICDAILAECPDVILDFDITEEGRNVGLSLLSRGKYFLVNNGPNYHNYDLPDQQWTNMFTNPGPARTWICRAAGNYDKWFPSCLFLTHYLPDPPVSSQRMNIGSLIVNGNGIWGDLAALDERDIALFNQILGVYKRVAEEIAAAPAKIDGATATTAQKYEKIDPETGKGVVVLFGFCTRKNRVRRLLESECTGNFVVFGNGQIIQENGKRYLEAEFDGADAVIVFSL